VAYSLKLVEPFGRDLVGEVEVNVQKDRPGHVRRLAEGEHVATARLFSEPDDAVRVVIEPPAERGEFRPTTLMERLSEAIELEPGIGKKALRGAVTGKNDAKELALRLLVADQFVRVERDGQAHRHFNERLYRAAEDPKVTALDD
jgi:hypothetical protein